MFAANALGQAGLDVTPAHAHVKVSESLTQWLARALYTVVLLFLMPLMVVYLLKRSWAQPAYRRGWMQRFAAQVPVSRGSRRVIWVHAVSVGETHAVAPLVAALDAHFATEGARSGPGVDWVFSSTTPTGREAARSVFAAIQGARFVYVPYDFPWLYRRFFRRLKPQLGLLVETELWPNLLASAQQARVTMVLVNARVSPSTARGLARFAVLSAPALRGLSGIVTQTAADAEHLARLGATVTAVAGNMKFDVVPKPDTMALGKTWREQWLAGNGKRQVVLAASTREGEEILIIRAWQQLLAVQPVLAEDVVLMVVPRHPQRFDEVASVIQAAGFDVIRRSGGWGDSRLSGWEHAVLLGDSMGEMPAYYAAADVALMGGSWLPFGGQNLIEACACGCPVALGEHTYNFEKAAVDAIHSGAAQRFSDVEAAMRGVLTRLHQPDGLSAWRANAIRYARQHQGATQRTVEALLTLGVLR